MSASYPNSIKSFPTLVDGVDDYLASHNNERGEEITAIETELGTQPKGSDASVKARLDRMETEFMTKAVYDTNNDGRVNLSVDADTVDGQHASAFAPAAEGVANGNAHDHSGGDGAPINHEGLSGLLGGESNNHYHITQLQSDKIFQYRNAFNIPTDHFEDGVNENEPGAGWGSYATNAGFSIPGSINHLNYKSLYYIAFTSGQSANPKCFLPRSATPSSFSGLWGEMKTVLRNMPTGGYIGVRLDNNQTGANENAVEILLRQGTGVVEIVGRITAAGSVSTYIKKTINFSPAFIGLNLSTGGIWYSNWYISTYIFIDAPAVEGLGFSPGGLNWQPVRLGITMYVSSASPAWYHGAFVDTWRDGL